MKKIISTCIALMVSAACSISAFAMEVPTNTTIQDLNGVRQYITVTFFNALKPSLEIRKVDSVTGDSVKGAKFQIWYASNHTDTGELNDLGVHYHSLPHGLRAAKQRRTP